MRRQGRILGLAVACALLAPGAAAAAPAPQPYGTDDYGGFHDILPPGTNGRTNLAELGAFLTAGTRPRHNDDQRGMYESLVRATPGLTAAQIPNYFKDATFGVRPGQAERTYSPRSDVTIVRDKDFGVPHIYASTRAGAMFAAGYAAAEDRLFFIDVLRHAGRAELSSFAGGAEGNREMDREQWLIAPYTEADLQRQYDQLDDLYGADGQQIQDDAAQYVAGVNRYIAQARLDPTKMPGEYAAVGRPLGPDPWQVTDLIATASMVGGIFGKGGGNDLTQAILLQSFQDRFGADGERLWREWAAYEDPDAPTTIHGRSFPYQTPPRGSLTGRWSRPDPGSVRVAPVVAPADAGTTAPGLPEVPLPTLPDVTQLPSPGDPLAVIQGLVDQIRGGLLPQAMSNALLVSAKRSASGHPLAVFGPQVSYFAPEILMEQDVHAPGIDARGAAFPGVNLYVQLGRGQDYAWSATSAGQDIIDTFAVPLCQDDDHYVYQGQCLAMETLERKNAWTPNLADQTAPGSETLRVQRTKLGIVIARGTARGEPVAYTQLRSTYFHEIDSARGFADFNEPAKMRNARDFQRAAAKIGYTFNWLYADDRDIAYFNSGANPRRQPGTTGQLPLAAADAWQGWNADTWTSKLTPDREHPQLVNGQDYLTSWNNKQARGYAGADSNVFSSVFRSDMLDQEIEARLAGERKMRLPQLVDAMEEAATTDLRAEAVLPLALQAIGTPSDPQLAGAVAQLRAWVADGAHRRDRDGDGVYEHADAIRILDAWWPLWMTGEFQPALGPTLFGQLVANVGFDNAPNNHGAHLGSAYQNGWYGYAKKDLMAVLGQQAKQPYAITYCGGGDRAACRAMLLDTLRQAVTTPNDAVYSGDAQCEKAGQPHDQKCYDKISFRPLGGATQPMIDWVNRPTYQQVVEVQGHRGR
jgi:acyl-homoserine lactone acylase PvdQ